jgi:hypothetical protein
MIATCELCGRTMKRGTTRHHLIPRTVHSNAWFKKRFTRQQMHATVDFCLDCHRAVHDAVPSEKELGRDWNTVERLRTHPQIARFVTWVAKQK